MTIKRRSIWIMSFVGVVATVMALWLSTLFQSAEGPFDPAAPVQSMASPTPVFAA